MKYIVIDLETTGIPGKDGTLEELQVIEFGAIIEDTNNPLSYDDIPKYSKIVRHNQYTGGAFAINMNRRIFEILANRERHRGLARGDYDKQYEIVGIKDLANDFYKFLYPHFSELYNQEDKFTEGMVSFKEAPFIITPAGKNFDAFDRRFINIIPKWDQYVNMRHRTIDPTTSYVDWYNDETPPGLGQCLERAGIMKQVTHKAVEDCWDTLEVLRKEYSVKKPWMKKQLT